VSVTSNISLSRERERERERERCRGTLRHVQHTVIKMLVRACAGNANLTSARISLRAKVKMYLRDCLITALLKWNYSAKVNPKRNEADDTRISIVHD